MSKIKILDVLLYDFSRNNKKYSINVIDHFSKFAYTELVCKKMLRMKCLIYFKIETTRNTLN